MIFSVAGHVRDLAKWMKSPESGFPEDSDGVEAWLKAASHFVSTNYEKASDQPPLEKMLKTSGLLLFQRDLVKPGSGLEITFSSDEEEHSFYEVRYTKKHQAVANALQNKAIHVAPILSVGKSVCSGCGMLYNDCNCSKWLDEGIIEDRTGFTVFGNFLTKRPAQKFAVTIKPVM